MPATFTLKQGPGRIVALNPQGDFNVALARALGGANRVADITIKTTGPDNFHANGETPRVPRGQPEMKFTPKLGNKNLVEIEPPVPLEVPLRTVRMPKGLGAVLVIDWAKFCAEQAELAYNQIEPVLALLESLRAYNQLLQNIELSQQTALFTSVDPQAAAARLRSKCMVKTKRAVARKTTTIRAFSRR